MSEIKTYKVAVIGCGAISVMHLDSIVAIDNLELVAVCDIKPEVCKHTKDRISDRRLCLLWLLKPADTCHFCPI